jgi:hypothetical protein
MRCVMKKPPPSQLGIVAVEHDVRHRYAGGFCNAYRLRLEHDRRQLDVRVRNGSNDKLMTPLAVVCIEQHIQSTRASARYAQPWNLDRTFPALRQESYEPIAHRIGHGSSPRAS